MIFVVTPDRLAARAVQRELGRRGSLGIQAGGFRRLLESLLELWVLGVPDDGWDESLRQAALRARDAFWSESIQLDEPAVLQELDRSLRSLLAALPLDEGLPDAAGDTAGAIAADAVAAGGEARWRGRYRDLCRLHGNMQGVRPLEQEMARCWLAGRGGARLEELAVVNLLDTGELEVWQREVLAALPAVEDLDPELQAKLAAVGGIGGSSGSGQRATSPAEYWLTCRDRSEEAQAAVSMVQQAVQGGTPAERVAIVFPHGSDYPHWVAQFWRGTGLPVQNLHEESALHDWQAELIRDLLSVCACGDDCEPMLYMSILANPLMPWSPGFGQYLAAEYAEALAFDTLDQAQPLQEVSADGVSQDFPPVFAVLAGPRPDAVGALFSWLEAVLGHTRARNQYGLTAARAEALLDELRDLSAVYRDEAFPRLVQRLLHQWRVGSLAQESRIREDLQGVYVLSTQEQLPAAVDELICLGFNAGSWTAGQPQTGVFDPRDWDCLAEATGLQLVHADDLRRRWDAHFTRLTARVERRCTWLLSRQELDGSRCDPSEYLLDCAARLQAPGEIAPERLLGDIRSTDHELVRLQPAGSGEAAAASSERRDQKRDRLGFGRSVLELIGEYRRSRKRDPDTIYSSPSKLETLMVSPLAWLLQQLRIESRIWGPLQLDVMQQGTIAHKVFELFFAPAVAGRLPAAPSEEDTAKMLDAALQSEASFLLRRRWRFERIQLQQEVHAALRGLQAWVKERGLSVLQTERKLQGKLWNMQLTGYADAILADPGAGRCCIIDYKKSKSEARRTRLQHGFDLQTYIYRELYRQTDEAAGEIISGYYTMNDAVLLLDSPQDSSSAIRIIDPGIPPDEQSQQARACIAARLAELQNGHIVLNTTADRGYWKAQGVGTYALDNRIVARVSREAE